MPERKLQKVLKPRHLWALAVGAVCSGNYYGFSYGFETGGPGGQLIKCLSGFLFIGSADEDLAAINFYDHEWIRICLAKVKY